ncbi:MAG: hypothetical protein ACTSVB_09235 [Candidatus Heimdallarchaeaceae archaeon]
MKIKDDFEICYENAEYMIERAIYKNAFIEAISLIHNTIELYLMAKIRDKIIELDSELIKEKDKILLGADETKKLRDVLTYANVCFLYNYITPEQYKNIKKFNEKRNDLIHRLYKKMAKNFERTEKMFYSEFLEFVRMGRRLQLELSPVNFTKEDIERISTEVFDKLVRQEKLPELP